MGTKCCFIVFCIFLSVCAAENGQTFNCSTENDRWMCTDECHTKSDIKTAPPCATPLGIECYGVPITYDFLFASSPLENFNNPLIKLFPSCYRQLLPLICAASYVPCKNMKVRTESGETGATFTYRTPMKKCTSVMGACKELFALEPSLKKLLPFSCDEKNDTFSPTCQITPSFLPTFESKACPWPLVHREKAMSNRFSNRIFDECYSPCRLAALELQWYEQSKFAFSFISLVVMVLFLVSAFFKSDALKRSISARFFVIGGVLPAVIYMTIWMLSSAEFSFKDVTCSLEGTRLLPTASPLNFGVCSWLQKLMSTCLIVCNITPLLSISFSIASRLQTRFTVSLIKNLEATEHFVWVALLAYSSSLPFVLTNTLGVERDEFSGVCLAGNLSTISMGTNFGVSIFFVLLIFGQTVLRTLASQKSSNENVAFVELLEVDKAKVNGNADASSRFKPKRPSGVFLDKNHLYSNLSIVAILLCYVLWIAAIGLHSVVVAGWPTREKETTFSNLKCLFNLSSEAQKDEAFRIDDHRQDTSRPECSSSALGYRPTYSFLVFVVLPIIPFIFVAIFDALPSIWNSSFGMGMWARRKLQILTTLSESNSQPTSKNRDTVESSRSCSSNSTRPVRRGKRTSRLYQAQREVEVAEPVCAPPTGGTLEEVQRLAQIFSMEVQGLAQERAELHDLSRVQDETLISLAQQLDHANAQLAALRGEEPPTPLLTAQMVEGAVPVPQQHSVTKPQGRSATHDQQALTRFEGFGRAQPVEEPFLRQLPAPQARFSPEMQPSTSNPFSSFQGFKPMQPFGQSTSQQPQALSDESDGTVPSYEDVETPNELHQRANGNLEEPRESDHDVPVLAPPPFPQLIPRPPPNRSDPYGVLFPMSSVMTVPEIQLRAQVLRQVLRTDSNIPVYPYQIAVILERAGILNRVDAQRPLRPNHVIYQPDTIEEMLGTTPKVPQNLRNPATFHEHIGLLAFQQGLTLAVIYRDAPGPPRNLSDIIERINIAEVVPAELRELVRQGDLNAISEARQIIERSPHAIRLNMENRVHHAFLYVRDFLDSRATTEGLLPANPENRNAQQPHDSDSAAETS